MFFLVDFNKQLPWIYSFYSFNSTRCSAWSAKIISFLYHVTMQFQMNLYCCHANNTNTCTHNVAYLSMKVKIFFYEWRIVTNLFESFLKTGSIHINVAVKFDKESFKRKILRNVENSMENLHFFAYFKTVKIIKKKRFQSKKMQHLVICHWNTYTSSEHLWIQGDQYGQHNFIYSKATRKFDNCISFVTLANILPWNTV